MSRCDPRREGLCFGYALMYLRTENPSAKEDGTTPKSNDYQLVVGVLIRINE